MAKAKDPIPEGFHTLTPHIKRDPFGFTWAIATHIEDPTPAEIKEREAKLFGSGA